MGSASYFFTPFAKCLVLVGGVLVQIAQWSGIEQMHQDDQDTTTLLGNWERMWRGVLFIFLVSLLSTLAKLPFEVYRLLHIDNHDTSSSSASILISWTFHQLKSFVASLVLGNFIICFFFLKNVSLRNPCTLHHIVSHRHGIPTPVAW